jgi:hypothetical protein
MQDSAMAKKHFAPEGDHLNEKFKEIINNAEYQVNL